MQIWILIFGIILLIFAVVAVIVEIRSASQHVEVMREGHRIEVDCGLYGASLKIDGKEVNGVMSFRGPSIILTGAVDDLNVKVKISKGTFKPLVKIFINNEYVDLKS